MEKRLFTGGKLIDGTGGPPILRGSVLVEGQRIVASGPADSIPVPEGECQVIEVGDRTILPALMDLHSMMLWMSYNEQRAALGQREMAMSVLRGAANGRHCLDAGVTTVRVDLCGHHGVFALREAFASGLVEGPRIFVPGRALAMTGGHAWMFGVCEADGPDEMRKAAREQLKAGADWIKLMASGGAGSPTERLEDVQLTVAEMQAAVEEAHKKGRYAFAHVTCSQAARNCLAAGVDSIEHGIDLEEDVLCEMKERDVFLVPTLGYYSQVVSRGEKGLVPEWTYRKSKEAVRYHRRTFEMALDIGVKIAAGTDSGQDWNPNGQSLLYELELMHAYGMPAMDVLVSATRRGAELLRRQQDLGTLEPGKLADILIVEGDPLADIHAIRNTWMVVKEGRTVFSAIGAR